MFRGPPRLDETPQTATLVRRAPVLAKGKETSVMNRSKQAVFFLLLAATALTSGCCWWWRCGPGYGPGRGRDYHEEHHEDRGRDYH
jgi:hypothetical protein